MGHEYKSSIDVVAEKLETEGRLCLQRYSRKTGTFPIQDSSSQEPCGGMGCELQSGETDAAEAIMLLYVIGVVLDLTIPCWVLVYLGIARS